jgi:hypothetical protein
MTLQLFIPEDNGGSALTEFELFINDGDDANEPTTKVSTYTSNDLVHTLTKTTDSLETGKIYKVRFGATNVIGNSEVSDIVRFALVDPLAAPGAPALMQEQTSTS